ncbi:MAG: hypothetical protein ABIH46_04025 [Chloroflexota bacterium]
MPNEDGPNFYVDAMNISVSPFTCHMMLAQRPPLIVNQVQAPPIPQCTLLMSPVNAKVMAMLLRRVLLAHEKENGLISVPSQVLGQLGISPEDW